MRIWMPPRLADAIIRRAMRTPYTHLQGADGSLYMARFWLRPYAPDGRGIAARVHHIARADADRHLHDHPWNFVSVVLKGGYVEARPTSLDPDFEHESRAERCTLTERRAGSVAFRRATDRHRIVSVQPDTWTLFITGPKLHTWGFFTPHGKEYWWLYQSNHEAVP